MHFYPTAAAAQQAGFRACLRCRPDATPGSPEWNVRADIVARAMRLIRDGVVDLEGVEGLAGRLGYSTRQLNRLITAEVGTGPLALARAQRSQTARVLLETTDLPIAHIAFAAGFASVRQCNDTIREIFADTPSGLRARAAKSSQAKRDRQEAAPQAIRLRLPCRRPFNPASVLDFLGLRALPGVEAIDGTSYRRTLRLPHGHAVVTLAAPVPGRDGRDETDGPAYVGADLVLSDLRDLTTAVARCRQLLDLDADPVAVCEALRNEPLIGAVVIRDPGRRVPGAAEGFELAVRAVIGQQVSVAGARTVAGRLVVAAGDALPEPTGTLTHLFPTPEALVELAKSDPGAYAMPASRRCALVALAEAVGGGDVVIDPGADPVELRRSLVALPGIGSWTAEYVALRALRDPDAFMPTDLGIRRGAKTLGLPNNPAQLLAVSERWRPWRSYAMSHLWSLPISTAEIPASPQKGRAA
jgi:AraC family transcriptional regulator of adaptative response / DNA-3-methyladenine glycosylase II